MLLNQSGTKEHYRILAVAWAGRTFDFYGVMLFSIGAASGLSSIELSPALGASLLFTAIALLLVGSGPVRGEIGAPSDDHRRRYRQKRGIFIQLQNYYEAGINHAGIVS